MNISYQLRKSVSQLLLRISVAASLISYSLLTNLEAQEATTSCQIAAPGENGVVSSNNSYSQINPNAPSSIVLGHLSEVREMRSIVSFDCAHIPSNVTVNRAQLRLSPLISVTRPKYPNGEIIIEVASTNFGKSAKLEEIDFSRGKSVHVARIKWRRSARTIDLPKRALALFSRPGSVQFRLLFKEITSGRRLNHRIEFGLQNQVDPDKNLSLQVTYQPEPSSVPPSNNQPREIWRPKPGTSWAWQLSGELDLSLPVSMYDVDLFTTSEASINVLKQRGIKVICYFSAGSYENFRPDSSLFPNIVLGKPNGWPGERWLDIRRRDLLAPIILARLDKAVQKGCDGVEPDNMDGYSNSTGFQLSAQDQINFNRWIAEQAHKRGLSVGLKNDLDQINQLVDDFDWALNEQCFQYRECELLRPFVKQGKAVFGVEYQGDPNDFCRLANSLDYDWLKKNLNLDAAQIRCR